MNHPTHDEIARKAYELWQNRGCPAGCDLELWLEAEQQLSRGDQAGSTEHVRTTGSAVEANLPAAAAQQAAIRAEAQQKSARLPQVPHHTAPKGKPAEPGKPVWPKPHSR
jgi:hypothetical protein